MRFEEAQAKRKGMKGMALIAHPKAEWAVRAYLKYGFHYKTRTKSEVLAWNNGVLKPHYEEGFELNLYPFRKDMPLSTQPSAFSSMDAAT